MSQKKRNGSMPNAHLHELFVDKLKVILGAERQLLKGLKKLKDAEQTEPLAKALQKL